MNTVQFQGIANRTINGAIGDKKSETIKPPKPPKEDAKFAPNSAQSKVAANLKKGNYGLAGGAGIDPAFIDLGVGAEVIFVATYIPDKDKTVTAYNDPTTKIDALGMQLPNVLEEGENVAFKNCDESHVSKMLGKVMPVKASGRLLELPDLLPQGQTGVRFRNALINGEVRPIMEFVGELDEFFKVD